MAKKIKDADGNVYVQKKPFYKKWWFIAIAVLGIFGALFGGGDDEKTTNLETSSSQAVVETTASESSDDVTEESVEEVTEVEEKVYGIGELVTVGDVEYTVNSFETTTRVGNEYFGKDANDIFVILNVTVTNKGNKAITVDSNFFTLLRGEAKFEADSSTSLYANDDAKFFLSKVNPESTLTGNVVFDVAETIANDPELQLQVQTGAWGTQKGLINLK